MERELKLNVNSEQIRSGLRKVDSSLKKTQRQGETTGKKISKATNTATRSFGSLGSAIGAAAAAMATLSFAKTIGGLQALDRSLGVVFGSAERGTAVFNDLQTMALQTPFSIEQLSNSVIKLRAAGIEPTNAQLALFADVASVTTDKVGTLNAITDLFSRTTAGGLGLEDLNRLADRGIPVFDILSQKMGLARLEVAKFGQSADGAQQILKVLTDEMETRFGGAAADSANDLTNMISNMGIAWTRFQESLGAAGGMALMTAAVGAATGTIIFFTENLETLGIIIGGLSTLTIPALIAGIKAIGVAIAANPIGAIVVGLTAVVAAAWQFREVIWEAIEKPLRVTIPSAVDYASIAFLSLKKSIGETLNGILSKINEFGNNLITKAPKWLQELFGINGQTFSLGIDIGKVNSEIDALQLTINKRIANFQPTKLGDKVTTEMTGGGLSQDPSLTGVGGGGEGGGEGIGLPSAGEGQLESQLEALQQSLMSEEQRIAESFERRTFMVEEAFQNELISGTYRQELILGLEQQFEDQKTTIAQRGAGDRQKVMSMTLSSTASALGSMSTLLSSAGKKQTAASKVFAKASILTSTAVAIMRAWELPWPANIPAIAAAALAGATQLAAVGKSGGISGGVVTPVSSAPSLAATPMSTPTQVTSTDRGEVNIVFTGNFTGWDDQVIDQVIDGIASAVDDRDVRLISPDSRNGQDLLATG